MPRLHQLSADFGQSPWLDNLRRDYLTSGALAGLRDRGVRGLTSNPTIFQKAIQGSNEYDEQFRSLVVAGASVHEAYWDMVATDIHGACDVFEPVHHATAGHDGHVSVEVDPSLAHDAAGTESAARALHQRFQRPNLMVKIPATPEGLPAIEQMIAEGRNVNVTLIFSLERHQAVMDCYVRGLERLAADPSADLTVVASVASFFISRVDVEIDRQLDQIGTDRALSLRGRAAVTQARLAYAQFERTFSGPRWEALERRGARVQRPLWASTGRKNPSYSDVMYVDELIGPNTVNTLPEDTLEAFDDHGTLLRTIDGDDVAARQAWDDLSDVGIDVDGVAARLETDGVAAFISSFDDLIDTLRTKASGFVSP